MFEELSWGLPVIGYLFLAGVGAGAATVSAILLLRGGGELGGENFILARYGALIAPLPVMIGTGLLILELGSFHAGNIFRFLNLFTTINLSPMSIGSWLLLFFIGVSLVYAYTFIDRSDRWTGLRAKLAWLLAPLGISVALYTGVLLGAMPARPFWNSPVLAVLFLVSAMSTGVAAVLLARALFHEASEAKAFHHGGYMLTGTDILLIGLEIVVIFLFVMFGFLTVGDVGYAMDVILPGGPLATLFWGGVVLIGLLLPGLVELKYVVPKFFHHRDFVPPKNVEILVSTVILIGGFLLRYVVVVAGQITGPVGI